MSSNACRSSANTFFGNSGIHLITAIHILSVNGPTLGSGWGADHDLAELECDRMIRDLDLDGLLYGQAKRMHAVCIPSFEMRARRI